MEFENTHLVAALGFALSMLVGAVANRTNFCTMGAVSDWINIGSKGRMAAWVLAMGIAVAGTQMLELSGILDLNTSVYRTSSFGVVGYIFGGLMFGTGMTLAGGCGQRSLVRLGSGNLKSLVVVLVLGITAYMTLRGLLGVVRLEIFAPLAIDLSSRGIQDQSIAAIIANMLGRDEPDGLLNGILAAGFAAALLIWSLRQPALRENTNNLLAGVVLGFAVIGGWIITGVIGADDFDPVPLESISFIAPTGNSISYLMTYTGSTINFGIAVVFGIVFGSFLYAVLSGNFKLETFSQQNDMINHLIGAVLMGFGGVLSLGCTIGQGLTGVSTLSSGAFIAAFSIIIGSAVTMRVQYHRFDDLSLGKALTAGIADILIPWRELS